MKLCHLRRSFQRDMENAMAVAEREPDYHNSKRKAVKSVLFVGGPFNGLFRRDPRKPIERLRAWSLPKKLAPPFLSQEGAKIHEYRRQNDGTYLYEPPPVVEVEKP